MRDVCTGLWAQSSLYHGLPPEQGTVVRFLEAPCREQRAVGTPTDGAPTASYAVLELDGLGPKVSIRRIAYYVERACERLHQVNYLYARSWQNGREQGFAPLSLQSDTPGSRGPDVTVVF